MAIAPTVSDPPKSATRPRVIAPAATATAERQQPQRARQDEEEGQRHHQAGDAEQQQRLVAQLPGAGVHHDRRAGDDVAAVAELEAGVRDGLRKSPIASWRSASVRSGRRRTMIWAAFLFGKR